MELTVYPRNEHKKSLTKQIRRDGHIPAVIYSSHSQARTVAVDGSMFHAYMRQIKKGHLPNTVFTLKDENGQQIRAVIKDIQYHRVTYNILHLDLLELSSQAFVSLNVPVEMQGQAECVGVKAGGALRLIKRHIKVKCLPAQIPSELVVNVQDLQIKNSKRVSDIEMPAGVELVAGAQEVVATVGKR